MDGITKSILFSAGACALLAGLLVWNRRRIETSYGKGGIVIFLALIAFFPLQSLMWPLSLCPPLNDPENPLTLGAGGTSYGLNYDDYFAVTLILTSLPVLSVVFLLIQSKWRERERVEFGDSMAPEIATLLSRATLPIFCLSVVFLLEFFRQEGIERLWWSPLDRFEGALWETGTEGGSQSGSPFMRVYLLFLFLSAAIATVSLAFRCRRLLSAGILLLCLPPFFVWESRGLSVVVSLGLIGWVLSLPTARARKWAIGPVAVAILAVYQAPLILRDLPGTGVVKFGAAARLISESEDYSVGASASKTLQSVSQSFPNMAYYYEEYEEGANEMDQVPLRYKLLCLSPTVSMVDGWADECMDLQLRVNYYTPISAWSELFLMRPWLPYVVLTLFTAAVLTLMRGMATFPLGRLMFSPVVALLYAVSLTVSSQYYSRMFSRYMWLTLLVATGFFLTGKVMAWARRGEASGLGLAAARA